MVCLRYATNKHYNSVKTHNNVKNYIKIIVKPNGPL